MTWGQGSSPPACRLLQVKQVLWDGLVAGEEGACPLLFGPQGPGWAMLVPQEIHGGPFCGGPLEA